MVGFPDPSVLLRSGSGLGHAVRTDTPALDSEAKPERDGRKHWEIRELEQTGKERSCFREGKARQ